jgi:mxaK protein
MKRKSIHIAFALSVAALGLATAYSAFELHRAQRVNEAIAHAQSDRLDRSIPQARFAHAALLASTGKYDAAVAAYKELIQSESGGLERAAQFNLGNVHLREALKHGAGNATQWLPMIELAKQSYRNLLREYPADWDARYNLEHALRLAPEIEETSSSEQGPPPDSERATSTISSSMMDLP